MGPDGGGRTSVHGRGGGLRLTSRRAGPNGEGMFTGIIEDIGRVVRVSAGAGGGRVLQLRTSLDPSSLAVGDSVCTNGVCLTATAVAGDTFTVDAGPETLNRTTVGRLEAGAKVNLERSVTPNTRLGGHLVMGHVDAVGQVRTITQRENAWDLTVHAPAEILKLIIPRGSVAVDGISLTVTGRDAETFGLSIIPHTWKVTTMADLRPGAPVNLEADVIARYVEGLLGFEADRSATAAAGEARPGLEALLKKHGY